MLKKLSLYTRQAIQDPQVLWVLLGIDYFDIEKDGLKGILDFENREPGCIGAMVRAFIFMLEQTIDNRFDIRKATSETQQQACVAAIINRLQDYHKLCTERISGLNHSTSPGNYRTTSITYISSITSANPNGTTTGHQYLLNRAQTRGTLVNGQQYHIENFYGIDNLLDNSFQIICIAP